METQLIGKRVDSTKVLLVDPKLRGVAGERHTVVAAASSSSKTRAEMFLRDCRCPSTARVYGFYD